MLFISVIFSLTWTSSHLILAAVQTTYRKYIFNYTGLELLLENTANLFNLLSRSDTKGRTPCIFIQEFIKTSCTLFVCIIYI